MAISVQSQKMQVWVCQYFSSNCLCTCCVLFLTACLPAISTVTTTIVMIAATTAKIIIIAAVDATLHYTFLLLMMLMFD